MNIWVAKYFCKKSYVELMTCAENHDEARRNVTNFTSETGAEAPGGLLYGCELRFVVEVGPVDVVQFKGGEFRRKTRDEMRYAER